MQRRFTLEYWMDEGWYVGRIKEVPGVFSQGETLDKLEDNITDACRMVAKESFVSVPETEIHTKDLILNV